jgi:CBS domain-containing membrane protein
LQRAPAASPPAGVPRTVSDIMTRRVQSALPETMIAKLVPPMADMGLHHMPVVDHDNHVVGIITQSDLIAALFQMVEQEWRRLRRATLKPGD